jgi:uncharacterized membrane protein YtjA (UPF0391 family)
MSSAVVARLLVLFVVVMVVISLVLTSIPSRLP